MWRESRIQILKKKKKLCYVTRRRVKQSLYRPLGFQDVEAAIFEDNQHIKVVRLSTLRIGCLYPPQIFLLLTAVIGWPQGHNAAGKIMSMKNSNDTIINRSRDRPAWSAVPQPTAPPCAPRFKYISYVVNISECTKCANSARLLDRPWTWRQCWSTVTVPLGSDLALMLLSVHLHPTFPHFTL